MCQITPSGFPTHGELLSYLFFDAEVRRLIAMGEADARRTLAAADGQLPWRLDPPTVSSG